MKDDYVVVGHVKRAVGLKGEVHLKLYSQVESVVSPRCFFIKESGTHYKKLEIIDLRLKGKKDVICKVRGITNRDGAEKIQKKEVYQRLDLLPTLEEDEYYWYELKGLQVYDVKKGPIGEVVSILETGASDCLLVKTKEGEILIPMVEGYIKEIDKRQKRCLVELPPGFIQATLTPYKKK